MNNDCPCSSLKPEFKSSISLDILMSLYGQCGARTSTFYEQDVAASTTATGRQMIMYAKGMIEDKYGNGVGLVK